TLDGLVRFDGVRMVVYSRSEVPEMTSNRCLALLVDRQGTLWIGTEDGGILRKSGSTFRAYGPANGLPAEAVLELAEDGDGTIWAMTSAGAVVMMGDDRWVKPESPAGRPPG